jgi:hypothetical protein
LEFYYLFERYLFHLTVDFHSHQRVHVGVAQFSRCGLLLGLFPLLIRALSVLVCALPLWVWLTV